MEGRGREGRRREGKERVERVVRWRGGGGGGRGGEKGEVEGEVERRGRWRERWREEGGRGEPLSVPKQPTYCAIKSGEWTTLDH